MSDPHNNQQSPYGYNVNTSYQPPVDEVVPAITPGQHGAYTPPPPVASHTPSGSGPSSVTLQFTDTTANSYVSGTIGKTDERTNLMGQAPRSDAPQQPQFQPPQTQPTSSSVTDRQRLEEESSKYAFYNPRRYRPYFDVDTKDVLWRVMSSFIAPFKPDFMQVTQDTPDLYGPFWIATTLIFVTAVAGNYADYIQWRKDTKQPEQLSPPGNGTVVDDLEKKQWYSDYGKMGYSAALFYGYVFVIGLALYFFFRYFRGDFKLVNIWCIYGYSLTVFLPVSIVCMAPFNWLRWLVVMLATALSSAFLVLNFKSTIYTVAPAKATIVMALVLLLHVALGLALKLYFFMY